MLLFFWREYKIGSCFCVQAELLSSVQFKVVVFFAITNSFPVQERHLTAENNSLILSLSNALFELLHVVYHIDPAHYINAHNKYVLMNNYMCGWCHDSGMNLVA